MNDEIEQGDKKDSITINREWKEAIEDLFILNWLEWDDNDPRGSLHKLIQWEIRMAFDPTISERARDLQIAQFDAGFAQGYDQGYLDGTKDGYNEGYAYGYDEAIQEERY